MLRGWEIWEYSLSSNQQFNSHNWRGTEPPPRRRRRREKKNNDISDLGGALSKKRENKGEALKIDGNFKETDGRESQLKVG